MLNFTEWPGRTWTISGIKGHPDAGEADRITFEHVDSAPNKLKISGFNCLHSSAHGSQWRDVECEGELSTVTGYTNGKLHFRIECLDLPQADQASPPKLMLSCSIDSDPLDRTQSAQTGTTCWTANDGG